MISHVKPGQKIKADTINSIIDVCQPQSPSDSFFNTDKGSLRPSTAEFKVENALDTDNLFRCEWMWDRSLSATTIHTFLGASEEAARSHIKVNGEKIDEGSLLTWNDKDEEVCTLLSSDWHQNGFDGEQELPYTYSGYVSTKTSEMNDDFKLHVFKYRVSNNIKLGAIFSSLSFASLRTLVEDHFSADSAELVQTLTLAETLHYVGGQMMKQTHTGEIDILSIPDAEKMRFKLRSLIDKKWDDQNDRMLYMWSIQYFNKELPCGEGVDTGVSWNGIQFQNVTVTNPNERDGWHTIDRSTGWVAKDRLPNGDFELYINLTCDLSTAQSQADKPNAYEFNGKYEVSRSAKNKFHSLLEDDEDESGTSSNILKFSCCIGKINISNGVEELEQALIGSQSFIDMNPLGGGSLSADLSNLMSVVDSDIPQLQLSSLGWTAQTLQIPTYDEDGEVTRIDEVKCKALELWKFNELAVTDEIDKHTDVVIRKKKSGEEEGKPAQIDYYPLSALSCTVDDQVEALKRHSIDKKSDGNGTWLQLHDFDAAATASTLSDHLVVRRLSNDQTVIAYTPLSALPAAAKISVDCDLQTPVQKSIELNSSTNAYQLYDFDDAQPVESTTSDLVLVRRKTDDETKLAYVSLSSIGGGGGAAASPQCAYAYDSSTKIMKGGYYAKSRRFHWIDQTVIAQAGLTYIKVPMTSPYDNDASIVQGASQLPEPTSANAYVPLYWFNSSLEVGVDYRFAPVVTMWE